MKTRKHAPIIIHGTKITKPSVSPAAFARAADIKRTQIENDIASGLLPCKNGLIDYLSAISYQEAAYEQGTSWIDPRSNLFLIRLLVELEAAISRGELMLVMPDKTE